LIPSFRVIRTTVRDVQKLQDSLARVFNAIQTKEILDGRLISDIEIVTGTAKEINHGLAKPIRGWIITDINADANVYRGTSTTPNSTFFLNASANCTVSLWVF